MHGISSDMITDWEGHQEFTAMVHDAEDNTPRGNKHSGYWYFKTVHSCVLCGRETVYKERKYTPKPNNPSDRMNWIEEACHEHFM